MKSQIFVAVPYSVPLASIPEFVRKQLEPYCEGPDTPADVARFDYPVGSLRKSFNDPVTEGLLPPRVHRSLSGNICDLTRLPDGLIPVGFVAADGKWHDLRDFGWTMLNPDKKSKAEWEVCYRNLISQAEPGWIVEVWVHS